MTAKDDTGSAAVEFVLVVPLLMLVCAAVIQICLVAHVRSTLVAAAAEGARAAAVVGGTDASARQRTLTSAQASVAANTVKDVHVVHSQQQGMDIVTVTVDATLPLVGLLGPTQMSVSAHALQEGS